MSHHRYADLQILVVDDEEFSRSIVVRILRKLGVSHIRQAADGRDGLNSLRFLGRVDCVIVDFNMPQMNGLQMLKSIRAGTAGTDRATHVAMLTGHSDMRLVKTAMALDVNAFLSKPTSLDVVAHRLDRMLLSPDQDLRSVAFYAGVELPTTITLSSEVERLREEMRLIPIRREEKTGGILVALERIPPNAQLARDLEGPDGFLLIPQGTALTPRLLSHLHDLRALDECVARLWIEPVRATPQGTTGQ